MPQCKWVTEILSLQRPDGSWGYFHSLSAPTKSKPLTTEQALRRLHILGLTKEDEPIQRAMAYLEACLMGEVQIPDRREQVIHWDVFTNLMAAAWLKVFNPGHPSAQEVTTKWAATIQEACCQGSYSQENYQTAYQEAFGPPPQGGRVISPTTFYLVVLLQDALTPDTEACYLDYLFSTSGIYYIYPQPLKNLPQEFASLNTSRYLGAIELVANFKSGPQRLTYVKDWLAKHQEEDGQWDLGPDAKDGIYFPISDSWRSPALRKQDCTLRIAKLIRRL